jgi:hypothetical protein
MSFMVAGTSSMRTTVASRATASTVPSPICLMVSIPAAMNPANTTTSSSAAEVTIRPERWSPTATARSLSPVSSQASLIRDSRNTS